MTSAIHHGKLENWAKTGLSFAVLFSFALALPAFGVGNKTYKTMYPVPCSQVWERSKPP
jgi:hypothetical protein